MMAYVVCQEFMYMYIEWCFYFCHNYYMVHVFVAIRILILIIVELHACPNCARGSRALYLRNVVIYPSKKFWQSHDCLSAQPPVPPHHGGTNIKCQPFSWCGSLKPDIVHPYCGYLTAFKTGYPLTSITWPILQAQMSTHLGYVFFWSSLLASYEFSTDHRLRLKWMSIY